MSPVVTPARALLALLAAGVLALCVAAALWRAAGGHWYVVETPSMGTTLPVGSLVVTRPVGVDDVRVGEVVTFHSPETRTVYTHRVESTEDGRLATRGDLNSVPDTGTIGAGDLVGSVVWHAPAVGWVLEAVPLLLLGAALTLLVGLALRPRRRRGWRQLGLALTVAVTNFVLQPWVGLVRLGQREPEDGRRGLLVDVVSTGLLPIRATQVDGDAVAPLRDGQMATMHLSPQPDGSYDLVSVLDLAWWGWALLVLVCVVPLLVSLAGGLRRVRDLDPVLVA